MNRAFGSNNWQLLFYETVSPAQLFSPAMKSMGRTEALELDMSNTLLHRTTTPCPLPGTGTRQVLLQSASRVR